MAFKVVKRGSEFSQIVILTLFITSGFLAVACLVFSMLIPSRKAAAENQTNDLKKLLGMFRNEQSDGLKAKRARLKQFMQQGGGEFKDLRTVVETNMQDLTLSFSKFPGLQQKPVAKANAMEYSQSIKFKDANMQDVLFLVSRVGNARPGAGASKMSFKPSRGEKKDKWNVDLEFRLFENEKVKDFVEAQRKKQSKSRSAGKPAKSKSAVKSARQPLKTPTRGKQIRLQGGKGKTGAKLKTSKPKARAKPTSKAKAKPKT